MNWKPKPIDDVSLIGPFECPLCGFHIGADFTYLDQITNTLKCPAAGCEFVGQIAEEDQEGLSGTQLVHGEKT